MSLKVFSIIAFIDIVIFVLMIVFSMTDEPAGLMAKLLDWLLRYLCGFPMVLFDRQLPFFLDSRELHWYMVVVWFANMACQTFLILFMKKQIRKNQ